MARSARGTLDHLEITWQALWEVGRHSSVRVKCFEKNTATSVDRVSTPSPR